MYGVKNLTFGFLPSAALIKATIINSGRALTGVEDIGMVKALQLFHKIYWNIILPFVLFWFIRFIYLPGCCAYTADAGKSFVSPFPDAASGKVRTRIDNCMMFSV